MSFKNKDLTKAKPKTGNRKDMPKAEDYYDVLKLTKDHKPLRILEGYNVYAMHWIPIKGKSGKEANIPKPCLNFNPKTEAFEENGCPYCKLGARTTQRYLFNAIDRHEQEDFSGKSKATSKEKKSGFKDPESRSKTPVIVLNVPPSLAEKFQKLSKLNKGKKNKNKTYPISDEKEGIDVLASFDKDATGENMYDAQRDEKSPLTKEERGYLIYDLDKLPEALEKFTSIEEAKKDAKELKKIMVDLETTEDSEYDSDDSKKSKGKKDKKGKGKNKKDSSSESESESESEVISESESEAISESESEGNSESESENNSESESENNSESESENNSESESESEEPKKKSKKKSKKSSSKDSEEESESEFNLSELDNSESEDDKKSKKSKSKSKDKKKGKSKSKDKKKRKSKKK